jgi:hypothetical protein
MAVGGEEGDDEWELDGLFRTISVDLREEKEDMVSCVIQREGNALRSYCACAYRLPALPPDHREQGGCLSSQQDVMGIPISFAIQDMNVLVHNPRDGRRSQALDNAPGSYRIGLSGSNASSLHREHNLIQPASIWHCWHSSPLFCFRF